jgi:hypothetical protein
MWTWCVLVMPTYFALTQFVPVLSKALEEVILRVLLSRRSSADLRKPNSMMMEVVRAHLIERFYHRIWTSPYYYRCLTLFLL